MVTYFEQIDKTKFFERIILYRKDNDIGGVYKPEEIEEFKDYFEIQKYEGDKKYNTIEIIPKTSISSVKIILKGGKK